VKKKQSGTMNRETALKLAAAGGIGALLPVLTATADGAIKPRTPASGSPMNLSYTVQGSLQSSLVAKNAKSKAAPAQGTITIQMWADPDPAPAPPAGTMKLSFDGDSITPKGKFDDKCAFDGKTKNGLMHLRVYFSATLRK